MPITSETLRRALAFRVLVDGHVDAAIGDMTRSWARLWNELAKDWALAVDQVLATGSTGRLTKAQIFRLTRVRTALAVSLEALDQLAEQAGTAVITRVPQLVADASAHELQVIAAQLPDVAGGADALTLAPGREITAIVQRATEQVTSLTRPLAEDAYQVMLAEVQRGVALGVNPRTAAARMLQRTRGGFDGGLSRATRIARTEMLDASRTAAHASDQANTDVLAGWRWSASLTPRTCPACLAMNGREFPTAEPGPHGHVNCRCARTPVTKSWADLGFPGMDEPEDRFPDARAWFDSLTDAEQLAIMGPTRLRLLRSGKVTWDDLAVKVPNPGWRPSYQPRTLTDLRSAAVKTA
jgi:SPP1 gp7 family putative phage head morphogenesis protein